MQAMEKPSLYDRLGGVYSIATVIDDFIDRIMVDPRLNANPLVVRGPSSCSACGIQVLGDRDGLLGHRRPTKVQR
jgi:hemoglobin